MSGETNLAKLLASMKPSISDECFVFITAKTRKIDLAQMEPWALISEDEGTTLIIDKGKADSNNLSYQGVFKRITLTVHSSLEAVGLTAAVSTKLAEHGISANVVAAFFHDHIFIPEGKAEQAMEALEELVQENTAFLGANHEGFHDYR
jgi:uncharacterized protein